MLMFLAGDWCFPLYKHPHDQIDMLCQLNSFAVSLVHIFNPQSDQNTRFWLFARKLSCRTRVHLI